MKRKAVLYGLPVMTVVLLYAAWPFFAAWQLREAIKNGDSAALAYMVEWEQVRETLKSSLAQHADLVADMSATGEEIGPTLWRRAKAALGTTVLDRFIDAYVTPEGLPKLFTYRKIWKERIAGDADQTKLLPWYRRFARFYSRIERIGFRSPVRIELEMSDRTVLNRRYRTVMEFKGFRWKLTGLQIATAKAAVP